MGGCLQYLRRIGPANVFNPYLPDGHYTLDLKCQDQRTLAWMMVQLSGEPGENMLNETFNGMPFEIGQHWLTEVPHIGVVNLDFVTGERTAGYTRRGELARAQLLPGPGRYRCIPSELAALKQDADFDPPLEHDEADYCCDADGQLKSIQKVFNSFDRDRSGTWLRTILMTPQHY